MILERGATAVVSQQEPFTSRVSVLALNRHNGNTLQNTSSLIQGIFGILLPFVALLLRKVLRKEGETKVSIFWSDSFKVTVSYC